jgi:ribosome-associated protein
VAKKLPPKKSPAKKPAGKKPEAKKAPVKTAAKKPALKMPMKKSVAKKAAPKKLPAKSPAKGPAKRTHSGFTPKVVKGGKAKDFQEGLRDRVIAALEDGKAENILCIDVREQSALADFFVVASGRSSRQVKALAEAVDKVLVQAGAKQVRIEGTAQGDWAVVDGGDVIVHLFRPEVRAFYRLEEVWGLEPPLAQTFKDL